MIYISDNAAILHRSITRTSMNIGVGRGEDRDGDDTDTGRIDSNISITQDIHMQDARADIMRRGFRGMLGR
jgi:hypothetical protein